MKYFIFTLFALTIPAANWLIGNFGTVCIPDGPCLIPVAPGLMAPSGVLMIGAALLLRDIIHEQIGLKGVALAIAAGAVLSAFVAPPALVVASVAAFTLSEIADTAVYTPLRKRHLTAAVVGSSVVGAVVDSSVFLLIAFGSLDFIAGQVVGKMWAVAFAIPVLHMMRRRVA